MRRACLVLLSLICFGSLLAAAPRRVVRLAPLAAPASAPAEMLRPEGRTRWDLTTAVVQGGAIQRTLVPGDASVTVEERTDGSTPSTSRAVYVDPTGGDAALRWLLPDRAGVSLVPGSRDALTIQETAGDAAARLTIETEITGIGWVHLPSGPREVVLQRALVTRDDASGGASEILFHRWLDPRAGVVAEIEGPASPDGQDRLSVARASVLDQVIEGASTLKIYVGDLYPGTNLTSINYGRDRGAGTTVASLTPAGYTTIGNLIAASSWDFSSNTTGTEIADTSTAVTSAETCNSAQCGYTVAGGQLERTDKSYNVPASLDKINDVVRREDRATDVTIWLQSGSQHEGSSAAAPNGENRFCYTTVGTTVRSQVPLWRFGHQDAGGWFFQAGDTWSGGPFACEQNIFNQVCGQTQTFDKLYIQACGTHTGKQTGEILSGGVVTVPSGHTFNALVARNVADFCVYLFSGCSSVFKVDEVRTVNYLWMVPHLGTVVRLQSDQNVADTTSFTTVAETDIGYGLFPPRTITVTGTTDTTVTLSWDPGLDTHRINDYKLYWDTDSGATSSYAFNSVSNAGQVSFAGTSATISGLTKGIPYYVTVASRSIYTDPSTSVATTFESLLYPTQVSGDPSYVYPIEVQGTTTCTPTALVSGVTVGKSGSSTTICWSGASDPCLTGYRILGAASPSSDTGFTTVADTGPETCWTGTPSQSYFLVVARGTGATGPWGSFGH